MKMIESVELVFENCQYAEFDIDNVQAITVTKIREEIHNECKFKFADEVIIVIKAKAGKKHILDLVGNEEETTVFDRIEDYPDITHIRVNYYDNDSDYITVNWTDTDPSGLFNANQFVRYDTDGNLYIVIAEGNLFYSDRFSEVEWREEE